jgi:hypothetical protein
MTYTGPMARTVYLASEMGWMLTTGFDKDEPNTVCKKRCLVRNNNSGKQQWIGDLAICK